MTEPKMTDREALRALVEAYAIRKRPNTLRALAAAREVLARPEPAPAYVPTAHEWPRCTCGLRCVGYCPKCNRVASSADEPPAFVPSEEDAALVENAARRLGMTRNWLRYELDRLTAQSLRALAARMRGGK